MKKILIIIICLTLIGCKPIEESNEKNYQEELAELFEKSYLYSQFTYSDLEYEDRIATLDDKEYKLIKNDHINNIESLNNIIEEIFVLEKYELFYEELYNRKDFIEIDGRLYVYNLEQTCDIGQAEFNNFTITEQNDEYLVVEKDNSSYHVFIRDGKLYLSDDVFKCLELDSSPNEEVNEEINEEES